MALLEACMLCAAELVASRHCHVGYSRGTATEALFSAHVILSCCHVRARSHEKYLAKP